MPVRAAPLAPVGLVNKKSDQAPPTLGSPTSRSHSNVSTPALLHVMTNAEAVFQSRIRDAGDTGQRRAFGFTWELIRPARPYRSVPVRRDDFFPTGALDSMPNRAAHRRGCTLDAREDGVSSAPAIPAPTTPFHSSSRRAGCRGLRDPWIGRRRYTIQRRCTSHPTARWLSYWSAWRGSTRSGWSSR